MDERPKWLDALAAGWRHWRIEPDGTPVEMTEAEVTEAREYRTGGTLTLNSITQDETADAGTAEWFKL